MSLGDHQRLPRGVGAAGRAAHRREGAGRQQPVQRQREPPRAAQHVDAQAQRGDAEQMQPVRPDFVSRRAFLPDLGQPPPLLGPDAVHPVGEHALPVRRGAGLPPGQ